MYTVNTTVAIFPFSSSTTYGLLFSDQSERVAAFSPPCFLNTCIDLIDFCHFAVSAKTLYVAILIGCCKVVGFGLASATGLLRFNVDIAPEHDAETAVPPHHQFAF